MANEVARNGYVYVCMACGKISKDKYGIVPDSDRSRMWDESCMLNCAEFALSRLEYGGGKVIRIRVEEPYHEIGGEG